MKFTSVQFLSAFLATAIATSDIASESKAGSKLLSKSRRVNDAQEEDFTWMTKYSIKFGSCHTIPSYGGEGQGGGEEEGGTPDGFQTLVKYHLCPTTSSGDSCHNCGSGGSYVAELREFVEAYTETMEEINQAKCEAVEENCNCQYYDDNEACLNKCYKKAGLADECIDDGNDFDVAEYMECREAEFGNNYYGTAFYIGPVCNGKSIHLKLFTDASCTSVAPKGTYEKYNYNAALPYSSKSLVSDNCVSCQEVEEANDDGNNNNNNNNNNGDDKYYEAPDPIEFCEELYEQSAKCEKNLKAKASAYRDTGSCTYINNVLPALEKVHNRKGGGAAPALATTFALTTIGASAAAYYFYTKVERTSVDLASKGDNEFA